MAAISFSGIGSGLDSQSIIDALVAAEKQPKVAIEKKKTDVNKQLATLTDLVSRLKTLQTRAKEVDAASELASYKSTSSDEAKIKVSSDSTATAGTYGIRINQLAQAQTTRTRAFASGDAGQLNYGELTIAVGTDTPVQIEFNNSDSLADVAYRINNSGAKVNAYVLNDGSNYRIMVTAKETGANNQVVFTELGDSLNLSDTVNNQISAAQDAQVQLFGSANVVVSRHSNTITDLIPGTTVELKALTGSDPETQISIAPDSESTKAKIKSLVDAYNDVNATIFNQLKYNAVTKKVEPLFGDSTLRGLQSSLASAFGGGYSHGSDTISAGAMGIKINNDGSLTFDEAKFATKIQNDPTSLTSFLVGADKLSARLSSLVDSYTQSTSGIISAKTTSLNSRLKLYDNQIERIEKLGSDLETRLKRQFTNLDATMAQLQTQSQSLAKLGS